MRLPSTKCPHRKAETTLTPRGGPKRSFDECLYIPCTDKGLFTSQPRRGERLFLHRDDDFYTVYKRVLLHPPCHFPSHAGQLLARSAWWYPWHCRVVHLGGAYD